MFGDTKYKALNTKHNKDTWVEFSQGIVYFLRFLLDGIVVRMKCNLEGFCYILIVYYSLCFRIKKD